MQSQPLNSLERKASSNSNTNALARALPNGGKIRIEGFNSLSPEAKENANAINLISSVLSVQKQVQISGAAASAGIVVWALSSGGILSSVLASVPSWNSVDPVSLFDNSSGVSDEDIDQEADYSEEGAADMLS